MCCLEWSRYVYVAKPAFEHPRPINYTLQLRTGYALKSTLLKMLIHAPPLVHESLILYSNLGLSRCGKPQVVKLALC